MIFVTVGTTDFEELVRCIDELAPSLNERIVCQIGLGEYVPRHCESFRFAPSLEPYMRQAALVITHGGLGSIVEALRLQLPVVALSNPDRRDLHQDDLLTTFERRGYIVWCRSMNQLAASIAQARQQTFATYEDPPCTIHTVIRRYLDRDRRPNVVQGVLKRVGL